MTLLQLLGHEPWDLCWKYIIGMEYHSDSASYNSWVAKVNLSMCRENFNNF